MMFAILLAAMVQSAPACPATPAALPSGMAGWSTPAPAKAAATDAAAHPIVAGKAARATLSPAAQVTFVPPLAKAAAVDTFGGLLAVDVTAAGRYRVALGAGAWIDVVRDGKALTSVAHGHGPECSGIRKMVDFDLAPGRYVLQLSGASDKAVTVMVVKLP